MAEHIDLSTDLIGLARVSTAEKKYLDASAYYKRAIAIMNKAGQPVPIDVEKEYAKVQKLSAAPNNIKG